MGSKGEIGNRSMIQPIISRIRLAAVYAIILLTIIVYGAINALQSSNNSPIDWVDSSFSERAHYQKPCRPILLPMYLTEH